MGHKETEKRPVRLTNNFIVRLTGETMWWDDDPKATGFGVRSYPGGGKSFFVDYRLNGRQRRYTIGPFPRWSAEAAREEAKKLRKEIDRGVDPAGDKSTSDSTYRPKFGRALRRRSSAEEGPRRATPHRRK